MSARRLALPDVARALAIAAVVLQHAGQQLMWYLPHTQTANDACWHITTFVLAWHMPVFFGVSGYLFGLTCHDERGVCRWHKLWRNVARLAALYLLWSVLQWLAARLTGGAKSNPDGHNELSGILLHPIAHLWFLHTLTAFLLFFAAFLALARRLSRPGLLLPLFMLADVAAIASQCCDDLQVYQLPTHHAWAFYAGALCSNRFGQVNLSWWPALRRRPWIVIALGLAAGYALRLTLPFCLRPLWEVPLTLAMLLLAAQLAQATTALVEALTRLGRLTLEVYLLHFYVLVPTRILLDRLLGDPAGEMTLAPSMAVVLLLWAIALGGALVAVAALRKCRLYPLLFLRRP